MSTGYWEIAPALTQERMSIIAGLLARVRQDALATHEPNKGDSNWVLGCRVYGRSCNHIMAAAAMHDWLGIIDNTLHFVFTVGGVPVRFGHGDPEQPRARLLRRYPEEIEAQQSVFDFGSDLIESRWRLIVETDSETLAVDRIVLIQATGEGAVINSWGLQPESVPPDLSKRAAPVPLASPTVRLKPHAADASQKHA